MINKIEFKNSICQANKCTVDPKLKVCLNCFRTLEEIDFWDEYSQTDKAMIYKATIKRKKLFDELEESLSQDLSFII